MIVDCIPIQNKKYNNKDIPVNKDEMFSYIVQYIITRTDNHMINKHNQYDSIKENIKQKQGILKEKKSNIESIKKRYSKIRVLGRVLKLINTLRIEGKLIGKNKTKVINLLNNIKERDFSELREIEESLSIYIPDN